MDFDVKRLAAGAGTFLSRAVQFTEEKLGQAEKTELDAHLENLIARAECTKEWTEKIMKQTEVLLQPNPNVRIEEFLYGKLEKQVPTRQNNHEQLGEAMIDSGHELGPGTAYGNALIKNFIEGDFRTISRERKLLQNKRLDLDVAKTRLKKARVAEARSAAEMELRVTQSEFDRQAEITRLLLEGVNSTHAHHLHCLNDFVEAQTSYYAQCYQYMVDLQKQLGSFASMLSSNHHQQARVLYDYDAAGSGELSLLADEVIVVSSVPGMGSDWMMGERGNQKGKVPITYLELLN
ncbi:hypothetical protein AAFF_G00229470 [Aldrovandia affinis]|uniref:Endophilin-B1 n=1 Tax=Aldrovandia affinis TaxID=143900 RepID=A0AAD7SVJ3_9TELE|nr:hypothetical protein AAFF_G00229470 [Aldrovandia affinis]